MPKVQNPAPKNLTHTRLRLNLSILNQIALQLPHMEENGFMFDPPSDEELELELDSNEEQEDDEEEVDERRALGHQKPSKPSQSPWDFASYSESVAEEHARRSTTSIDFKISKHRSSAPLPAAAAEDAEDDADDSEPDRQVSTIQILKLLILRWINPYYP